MKKFPLNLSKFKTIKQDKDSTTLQHPDGHTVTISHKTLSPRVRDMLPKMAEGGPTPSASSSPAIDPKAAKEVQDGANQSGWNPSQWKKNIKEGLGMAKGGQVQNYDEGGDVDSSDATHKGPITINIGQPNQMQPVPPQFQQQPQQAQQQPNNNFTMGSIDAPDSPQSQDIPGADDQEAAPQQDQSLAQAQQNINAASSPNNNAAAEQTNTADSPSQENLQAPQLPNPEQGYAQGVQAADLQAQAEGNIANQQAGIKGQQIQSEQDLQDAFKRHLHDIMSESDDYIADIKNQHIDPNAYFGNKSTPAKIATGIGLILGGIGGGLMHQSNPALDFLNANINRDIDAQKANLDKSQNLLKANFQRFNNMRDATDMTRIMMAHQFVDQLEQAALKSGSKLAQARALQIKSDKAAQYAPIMQQLAMRRALYDLNSQSNQTDSNNPTAKVEQELGVLRSINPDAAKEIESRLVPGVGVASVPVTPEVRDQLVKKTNLIQATDNLRNWVKQNGGTLNPAKRAEGQALAMELQQIYRQGVGASTSEGEQKVIDGIVSSNPGAILQQITTDPKLKALQNSMTASLNTLKKQHGLPQQQAQEASSPQIKIVNGVKYMRGPDGKAVRVK